MHQLREEKMENQREVAKYLAGEIAGSGFLDMKDLESKIYACLAVMSPIESRGKEINTLQNKLATIKSEAKKNNVKHTLQVKFWKGKVRGLVDAPVLEEYFQEMDEIMKANGVY